MKTLKKALALALCAIMTLSSAAVLADDVINIGILQFVEHNALDAARVGFINALADNGYVDGETIKIDYQNASGDQATTQLMAEQLVNSSDLILGIATPVMQALAGLTQELPLMGTAVTDYVAAGLVASNEAPGLNVSGTTDMNPIDLQIELALKLVPDAKTIGILYTSSEVNSEIQANIAKAEAEAKGLTVLVKTVSALNEVQQAMESLVGQVEVVYIPTDNIFASSMTVVASVAKDAKLPVVCSEENMVHAGGLATIGLNYEKLGYQTGVQAAKILKGEAEPSTMPIEGSTEADMILNQTTANEIGLTFSQELVDAAVAIVE